MKICDLLTESRIVFDLKPGNKIEILKRFVRELKNRNLIQSEDIVLDGLIDRENLGSTGLERGIAIPHALIDDLPEEFIALALIKEGTNFEALDQKPTYVFLMLLENSDKPGAQLKTLAHVCRLIKETDVVDKIRNSLEPRDVCRFFKEEEEKII